MNVTPDLMQHCVDGDVNTGLQPQEEDVQNLREFTGLDRAQALVLLSKWPRVEEAAEHYYSDPNTALREAYSDRQWQPQDNIPYADDMGPGMALSRPPSPHHRPPENFIDLSAQHAEASRQTMLQSQAEDEDFRRAMALSMQDPQSQESGVTSTGQHFGRATRDHYPERDWALAPIASSREVFEQPPPAKRRRIGDQPAFLKGSPETGYLGPLLTIYHSIPLAREALLFSPLEVYSYGHNTDWWSGSSDENNKAVSFQYSSDNNQDRRNYLCEIQCLVAFLDETKRSYASVDSLADLRFYRQSRSETPFTKFLETWIIAAMSESIDEPLTQIFTTVAARSMDQPGADAIKKRLVCVEPPRKRAVTLNDVFSLLVWNDSPNSIDDVWLDETGQIFTIRMFDDENPSAKLDLDVPEIWYADRYMSDLKEASRHMRQQRANLLQLTNKITRAQHRLSEMSFNHQRLNVRKALETGRDSIPIISRDEYLKELGIDPSSSEGDFLKLQSEFDALLNHLDTSINQLEQRKLETQKQIQNIMADMIIPETSSQPLHHKYTLHGVSTTPNVIYVRKPNHDLIGEDSDSSDTDGGQWQWWRMAWGEYEEEQTTSNNNEPPMAEETPPFSVRKVSLARVLQAVKHESSSAVLVYASDVAMQFASSPLSTALRKFVEQDNRAFEDEISADSMQSVSRTRSWSEASTDTINGDANDDGIQHEESREMTPMSTSTIREWDGQPSPKRPRSSEDSLHDNNQAADMPPSYETLIGQDPQEMQQVKSGNKIGMFADQLMEKYVEDDSGARPRPADHDP